MLKCILFLFVIFIGNTISAQKLIFKHQFVIPEKNQIWIPDNTGSIFLYGANSLSKVSQGQLPSFSQSIKSIGSIDQILPVNALKTYLFSQTQQQLCLIDNTLSMQNKCIDLEEFEVQYAQVCAISSRPDLVYVYDQYNSSLFLIDVKKTTSIQKVDNLEGLLGQNIEVLEMLEHNNNLFIRTKNNDVFELDMFLNFKRKFSSAYKQLLFFKDYFIELKNNTLHLNHLTSNRVKTILLKDIDVKELKINGNSFYFSNKKKISVYEFNPE